MPQASAALGLRDDGWYILGHPGVSNVRSTGLTEGTDFEVDPSGKVRRLKDLGERDRVFTFTWADPPLPEAPVFDTDASDLGAGAVAAVAGLRQYLAIAPGSVTAAQRETALRIVIRLQLGMLRAILGSGQRL